MTNVLLGLVLTGILVLIILLVIRKPKELDRTAIKDSFSAIALEALERQKQLGGAELDAKKQLIEKELNSKKELIDQRLEAMNRELGKVEESIKSFGRESSDKMQGVTTRLDNAAQVIKELNGSTARLNEILGSSQKRGEWGQRMAKDILDLAGLREGINYIQQESTETGRPDYTFVLPNGLKVNMDCKFPLSNYKTYIEAVSTGDKDRQMKLFLSDARARLKEVAKRDYIDPNAGTLDYAIMFISNEQVFNFINENDGTFIDDALKMKVVVCSPFTLYAFVSVMRQAAENFKMEKASREILAQLGKFAKQWEEFKTQFEEVGTAIDNTKRAYDKLLTTRGRMLEVPLKAVERIMENEGIPPAE
ncbi:MAG: DNA recombination protein RmuC [Spirochaetia bacterium]|nr:DNA recombination protein RmuC [Spirochaetia bacterium]